MANDPGFEESVISSVNAMMDAMIDAVSGSMGTPPGAKAYTRQEQIDEWMFTPIPDPQERMNKALEMHVQGATPETITDFLYPNLRRLVTNGRRPDEQIAFAREMRKLAGWPTIAPQTDEQIAATIPTVPQSPAAPVLDPTAAPMQQAPVPTPAPVSGPMANPLQPQPAPAPWNPLTGTMG